MELKNVEFITDFEPGRFQHVLFDFDGTISLLREGWQSIMEPMMIQAICASSEPTLEVVQAVRDYIEESTGIQTIVQMENLARMVRESGRVPEAEILDAQAYKKIYNDLLMVPVQARLDRLASGELSVDDATVAGSRDFVKAISRFSASLYIFSGTDREDVCNEARLLQVDHHFSQIWGALGTIAEYSKEKVLAELIAQENLQGPEVLIIGDGPVEIQNAKRFGCVSIGVASDEVKGYGMNEYKRKRLIKAGADIIISDFREGSALCEYLFAENRR